MNLAMFAPAPFVVGVGRSGTTLLRLMLDAHHDLAIPAETHFLPALLSLGERTTPQAALDLVTRSDSWANMGMTSDGLARVLDGADSLSAAQAARAFFHLYSARFGKTRWGDKTPPYRNAMLTIAASLPEAHFIHMIRDGRDVALSYRGLWFGPGDDLESQARFWVQEIEQARVQGKSVNYVEVRFEDLVTRPADTLTELCDWLDLPFDPAMLDYHIGASRRISEFVQPFGPQGAQQIPLSRFISIHERTSQAPDASRIARWKTEMVREERGRYEEVAGSLLASLGYDVES